MNKAQKFLIDNKISDVLLDDNRCKENALKWIYLSDVLEQYAKETTESDSKTKTLTLKCNSCGKTLY